MNQMLTAFLQRQAAEAKLPEKPTKTKTESKETVTFESIIENKPPSKKVLEYIKHRLNELYEHGDGDT